MSKEWRPDDWEYFGAVSRDDDFPDGYERGASAMLAARDKWWIEKIEADGFSYEGASYGHSALIISLEAWQERKKELEGNNSD